MHLSNKQQNTGQWVATLFDLNFTQLLLLSCFSRVRLYATPQTAAHQAPPSLGFSRQETEWVAISFSNHESEK